MMPVLASMPLRVISRAELPNAGCADMGVGPSDVSWGQLAWGGDIYAWSLICLYWSHTLCLILG